MKTIVGHSEDPSSSLAVSEVITQLQQEVIEERPQAALVLAAIDFDFSIILQALHEAFPNVELVGGTTDGEISSRLGFQRYSLVVMLFCSHTIQISAGIGRGVSNNPEQAAQVAIAQARQKVTQPPKLCLIFPESLGCSGDRILHSLQQVLGPEVTIIGGATGDNSLFKKTYQFYQTEIVNDSVPLLLFSGDLQLGHGVASGVMPISDRGRVTSAISNTVYEIDHKPAADFYRYYLGSSNFVGEHPLAIMEAEGSFYLRWATSCNETDGSISFAADVPLNSEVCIAEADRSQLLMAIQASVAQAIATYPTPEPEALLIFSCAGRRHFLGTQVTKEYQLAMSYLAKIIPCIGFYTYGEIVPPQKGALPLFHNLSFVTLLLGDGNNQ
ncbi:MAG: hypothetical protein EA001_12500 [Oscillatoriales cyanobacterium]|nr:MAG: hypothetical protein EA001_12500 [Oscillatoriales cyanobacterium]